MFCYFFRSFYRHKIKDKTHWYYKKVRKLTCLTQKCYFSWACVSLKTFPIFSCNENNILIAAFSIFCIIEKILFYVNTCRCPVRDWYWKIISTSCLENKKKNSTGIVYLCNAIKFSIVIYSLLVTLTVIH